MNKDYVYWNLSEAKDEISRTLEDLAGDSTYGIVELVVAMAHTDHHLNTAWNARDASAESARACSHADFDRWRQFPNAEELTLQRHDGAEPAAAC
jgi:hypothetical protein